MREGYKQLGDYIRTVDVRNTDLEVDTLLGVSITKMFIPSIANTVGTDMSRYKIIEKGQFAYGTVTSRNGDKISIAHLNEHAKALVSQVYIVFEVIDENKLLPEYLMMWFSRPEFDRYARYRSHGSTRETFDWEEMCEVELPVPSIEKQREIVAEYQAVEKKIKTNEAICEKLEETAQTLYRHWFVDFENENIKYISLDNYIETNPRLTLKHGQIANYTEMKDVSENKLSVVSPIKRKYKGGSRFQNNDTLFARITPCLENGKTGFVDYLKPGEIGFGSTEFIVIRGKENISPYWVYCLCKDENFRTFAINSMTGTSGRQRVHESYLLEYKIPKVDFQKMDEFHSKVKLIFKTIKKRSIVIVKLSQLQELLLSRMAGVGKELIEGE